MKSDSPLLRLRRPCPWRLSRAISNGAKRLGSIRSGCRTFPWGALGDPLVSLTYAAGVTTRLKLGANLVPLGRHPMWFAKQLAQLDALSNGRLLVSFVPGLGSPAERRALGYPSGDRGKAIDAMIALMRRWWAGETVSESWENYAFADVAVEPRPLQSPLEIWLGGAGPAALRRVGNIADGWLTSAVTPQEAGAGRRTIESTRRRRGADRRCRAFWYQRAVFPQRPARNSARSIACAAQGP